MLRVSFDKGIHTGNEGIILFFLKKTEENSKISLRRFFGFGVIFRYLKIGFDSEAVSFEIIISIADLQ